VRYSENWFLNVRGSNGQWSMVRLLHLHAGCATWRQRTQHNAAIRFTSKNLQINNEQPKRTWLKTVASSLQSTMTTVANRKRTTQNSV